MKYELHNIDCFEFMQSMRKVEAVITDPPYGISASKMRLGNGQDLRHGDWDTIIKQEDIKKILSKSDTAVIWGGNYYAHFLPPSKAWLVYDKKFNGLSFADVELAWTNIDTVARIFRYFPVKMDGGKVHITQKPEALMRWCIELCELPRGSTIFDPFMGSGTTGVACMELGFNFIGCEIDPDYFAIAEKRIKQASMQEVMFK